MEKNQNNREFIILASPHEEGAPQLHGLQAILAPHIDLLIVFWWMVWCMTLIVVIHRVLKEVKPVR